MCKRMRLSERQREKERERKRETTRGNKKYRIFSTDVPEIERATKREL